MYKDQFIYYININNCVTWSVETFQMILVSGFVKTNLKDYQGFEIIGNQIEAKDIQKSQSGYDLNLI